MAWRIDDETGDVVISFPSSVQSAFQSVRYEGIAPDPYTGLNKLTQVNLEVPNEISVGYPITTSTTSGGTLGKPIARSTAWFAAYGSAVANGSPSRFAMLDATGQVYESTSITGTWTLLATSNSTTGSTSSDGIAYYLGYLFKTRGANIDYWNGTTWATNQPWQTTLTAGVKHFMYVGSDNILYITNGNFVASLSLTNPSDPTTFDPNSSGTYTFTINKLQLPQSDWAISLAEVGGGNTPNSTLLIGGIQNAIYPWDKTSSSFNFPIYVADSYITNIVSANQNAFIFAGKGTGTGGRGRIYITNGAQADLYFKIPDYIFGQQDPYYAWGDAIFHRNNLIFGFFVIPNSTSSPLQSSEVWAIDFTTKAFRSISSIPANATAQGNATCLISPGSLAVPGFGYIVGWDDNGSAPGIGYSGTTAGTGSAIINTDLIPVGTFLNKKTFKQVEVKLRTALASGESVSIVPFADGTNATSLTFSPALSAGVFSGVAPVTFQANQWLYLQVSLTGNSASSGCRLFEIRLR